jgi:hypothetical protein
MEPRELDHWPYLIYRDDLGILYVHDNEVGLVFVRERVGQDRYSLSVIVEEDNPDVGLYRDILSPEPPYGISDFAEITLKDWGNLVKDYLRHKHMDNWRFNEWINEKFYIPLGKMLWEQSWLCESMPYPGAPQEDWASFDRALALHRIPNNSP